MPYHVFGADRHTGRLADFISKAATEDVAREDARLRGMLVEKVAYIGISTGDQQSSQPRQSSPPPRAIGPIQFWVGVGLVCSAIFASSLWHAHVTTSMLPAVPPEVLAAFRAADAAYEDALQLLGPSITKAQASAESFEDGSKDDQERAAIYRNSEARLTGILERLWHYRNEAAIAANQPMVPWPGT